MQVNRQQLMDEGYNILRNVVPPDQLQPLRNGIEHMVNRRKELSAQRRTPDQPPGGEWAASGQPRLKFSTDCDSESANAIEFLAHENTLGVAQQLMDTEDAVPHNLACLCSATAGETWSGEVAPRYWPGRTRSVAWHDFQYAAPRSQLPPMEHCPLR